MSENPYTPDTISTKHSAPGIIVATGVCVCIAVPLLYCFYACAVLSPPGVSDKLEWRMDINVHAFKCRWSLSSQIKAFNLLHLCVFQLQSLAWLEQKLISLCSFACQTHYKVIFKTQAQIASCMRLDKCTLKKLAMQSTQKIWPVSSTFIIACHVRQLFRNHFPMLRVYKYGIWKICFFLSLTAALPNVLHQASWWLWSLRALVQTRQCAPGIYQEIVDYRFKIILQCCGKI